MEEVHLGNFSFPFFLLAFVTLSWWAFLYFCKDTVETAPSDGFTETIRQCQWEQFALSPKLPEIIQHTLWSTLRSPDPLWQEDSRLVITRSPSRIHLTLILQARRNRIITRRKKNPYILLNHSLWKDSARCCAPNLLLLHSLGNANEAAIYWNDRHCDRSTGLLQGEHNRAWE